MSNSKTEKLPPLEYFGNNKFARVGISHISRHIAQHIIPKMSGRDSIHVNTSAQPNSNPHFGTVTTMMTVFAIAAELKAFFKVPVKVTFDQLENAPDRSQNGLKRAYARGKEVEYQISLADAKDDEGQSLCDRNMRVFRKLFDYLATQTGISYEVRSYRQCQSLPSFRRALLTMFKQADVFTPIVSPSGEQIRLRFPCPVCSWVDKGSVHTSIVAEYDDSIVFRAYCPEHGEHDSVLNVSGSDFFDTNTPLRDVAKGASLIEESRIENSLPVMVDGRDWSGRWNNLVFSEGITRLGYGFHELPVRFFTPVVTDRLGAKLSKSLYVGQDTYEYMPKGFMNYEEFMSSYGNVGLETLWQHIRLWAQDPAYLDRDGYSVDYFRLLLEGNLPNPEIK